MKTSFWRRWCHSVLRAKKAGQISRGRPRRKSLGLEAMEDRVAPSLTPQMVLDINPGGANSVSFFSELVVIGSTTYFGANDGVHGIDLWKSDGTADDTVLVKDFSTGVNSYLRDLTNVNGTLFFSVFDGTHGNELWKSDGTPAGTVMVKDIHAGSGSSNPGSLTNVSGTLFFSALDGTHGFELWKSDGTEAGTTLVKDINPNPGGANSYPSNLTNVNGTLFFTAADGQHGVELWKSNGTAAGTVELPASDPGNLTNVNGTLFFSAYAADGIHGQELWKSDGTAAGTVMVTAINPSLAGSSPLFLTNVNGTLFFRADDGTHGMELWRSDGTAAGTTLVNDIYPGGYTGYYGGYYPNSSIPSNLTNQNGTLFFTADDGTHGWELWKSDGTPAGTTLVKDLNLNGISNLTNINGTLFFSAPWKLWQSDGTAAGTVPVANLFANSLTNVNGTLFFAANDGIHGTELWKLVDDGRPSVTIGDATVTEGHEGTLSATFTVTLSTASDQPVTVDYATADGTAAAGSDYQAASDTLTFAPGETSKIITVLVNGDRLGESNETFFVNLGAPTNATIAHGQGVGTIVDDEPRISIGDATVIEDNTGMPAATFTVTLSAASSEPVTVAYATADASATAGSDYQAASGTLTFAPGDRSKIITILVNGDRLAESNETFLVNLSAPTNASFGDRQGVGTIIDDEPRLSIGDGTVSEGNIGTRAATFTVNLSAASSEPVTVTYATANATATAGSDYQATSGTLTIPAGQTTGTITVPVNGDRLPEATESFFVNLSSPTNAIIVDSQSISTIFDDEPRISISDVTRAEGKNHQTTLFVFTVTLSTAYDQPVTMSFATANGTATTSNSDYVARSGTLTFAPGETTKTITIEVKGDNRREANETFYLDLSGLSSNGLFTKTRGIGTILNDD